MNAELGGHQLVADHDAVIVAGGAEQPRDLPVPGREVDAFLMGSSNLPR